MPGDVPIEIAAGSIHGVVTDGSGAIIEGARIDLAPAAFGAWAPQEAVSDSTGSFSFSSVPAGAFKLTISQSGFIAQTITGLLRPGENYKASEIVLVVSLASTEVRVTASEPEIAQEQFREEEQQRVLGIIPNYYVSYVPNPPRLTAGQKFNLAWKTATDPVSLVANGAFAGAEQASNAFSGYGQGAKGYAKRFGASFADSFDGGMIGGALLPVLLKQDPRYFYKGTGSIRSRILYAVANGVVCKGDNGHWQPNYSGILGGIAAGGISNLYYPAVDRSGVTLTFENALIGTAEGVVQNLLQEFVIRRLTPKLPNYAPSQP